jgi:hypothetical protein
VTSSDQAILNLDQALPLGEGFHRICYVHPGDDGLCVKVPKEAKDEVDNEIDFIYSKHLEKRDVPLTFLPRCHGWVETSRGRGLIFQRIRNADGSECEPFRSYLLDGRLNLVKAMPLLNELRDYLLEHSILLADVGLTNLLVQELRGRRVIYLIDGLGSRKLHFKFTLRRMVPFLSRSRTKQKWRILLRGIGHFMKDNDLSPGLPKGQVWS